jgi:hypothetical protein
MTVKNLWKPFKLIFLLRHGAWVTLALVGADSLTSRFHGVV